MVGLDQFPQIFASATQNADDSITSYKAIRRYPRFRGDMRLIGRRLASSRALRDCKYFE